MDMAFPTIGGDVHTAGRLVVDDGPPMEMTIFVAISCLPMMKIFHCREALPKSERRERRVDQTVTAIGHIVSDKIC